MIRGLNKLVCPHGLGYMMSSYTAHTEGFLEAEMDATKAAANLLKAGLVVFAPISYGPGIERAMLDGETFDREALESHIKSHEFWMPIDERFFSRCDYGILAMTPGWHRSTGIAIEVFALLRAGKPIYWYDIAEDHIWTMGEAEERWPEEFDVMMDRAAKEGASYFLHESAETQSEAGLMTIIEKMARRLAEEDDD